MGDMFRTYDDYLARYKGPHFITYDKRFDSKKEAVTHSFNKKEQSGELTRISFANVPDITCMRCGELLFDFQTANDMQIGLPGDDIDCYFDVVHGVICRECAREVALIDVEEESEPPKTT
jgi:hypothetical protein